MSRWKTGDWRERSRKAEAETGVTAKSPSLCLLTNAYPDFPESNRVVFLRDLAHLLNRHDWDVCVVAPRVFPGSRRRDYEGDIRIRRFSSFLSGKLLIEYPRMPVLRLTGYLAAGLLATVKLVRENKCRLIHAHWAIPAGFIGVIAGKMLGVPVVVTAHGSDILVTPRQNKAARRVVEYVLSQADAVTSVADHITRELLNLGVPEQKILTFPMSVPSDSFCPSNQKQSGSATKTIFSNRNLYPIYNIELLVRATHLLTETVPGLRVVIAGEGSERERLVALTRELGGAERIHFVGTLAHEAMPDHLRQASVYVSTSLSDGASVSLLEAMACGVFPVVADIAANREWIVDGENGFLFDPRNPESLAQKVRQALEQPTAREQAREINVRIIKKRADWESNIKKLLNLYDNVLKGRM